MADPITSIVGGGIQLIDMFAPKTTTTDGNSTSTGSATSKTKTTQQRVLSAAAMNKIMSDMLGSEQGLASLASGQGVAGSFGGSGNAQLAQDFLTKIAGELAVLTAPTVTESNTDQTQAQETNTSSQSKSRRTVICTELLSQGHFPAELYYHPAALEHFLSLDKETVSGYHAWAVPVVSWMKKSPLLCKILRPIVLARYLQIIYGQRSILGTLTIYLGQPICRVIGSFKKENENGSAIY